MSAPHFESATDLAQFLDTNCRRLNPSGHDRDFIAQLRAATCEPEVKPSLEAELLALTVWFSAGKLNPEHGAVLDGKAVRSELPSDLSVPPFEYYSQRFDQTTNHLLKARYALLLWNAPRPFKRKDGPQVAIDQLLLALPSTDCTTVSGSRDCRDILQQLCALSTEFKHQPEAVRAAVLDRYAGTIPFERKDRSALFRIITDHGKLFRPVATDVLAATRTVWSECQAAGDNFACLALAQMAVPFAQASSSDVREWHLRQGQANEAQAEVRLADNGGFVATKFYTDAARAYQLAGDEAANQAVLEKAQQSKEHLRLNKVAHEFEPQVVQALNDDIERVVSGLLELDGPDIFEVLSVAPLVVPDFETIKQEAAKAPFSFADLVSVMHIDVNKNFHYGADAEEGEVSPEKIRLHYTTAITVRLSYLQRLFGEGTKTGKITFPAFTEYLSQRSWVSQPIQGLDTAGDAYEYDWLPMIIPACREFFAQLELLVAEKYDQVSFVLCLDSLVPKIEALMRELLHVTGNATVATGSKGGLHEIFFDGLLEEMEKMGVLSMSEAQFFRFVFTPFSQNLRNNIAHGYYKQPGQYSLDSAILVFCALLRLVGFPLSDKPADEEAKPVE